MVGEIINNKTKNMTKIIGNNWGTYNDKLEKAGDDSGVPIKAPGGAWATSARKPKGFTHTRNWLSDGEEAGFVACKGGHPPSSGIVTE